MKDYINNVKNQYMSLNARLNELISKEKELNLLGVDIYNKFEAADNEHIAARKAYRENENIILKERNKYLSKRHKRHVFSVMWIVCAICGLIFGINLSLFTTKILPAFYCFGIACTAAVMDIYLFWDKLRIVYKDKFEKLESTKKMRDESESLLEDLNQKNSVLEEAQKILNEHSIKLNSILDEKKRIQNKIKELKEESFDYIFVDNQEIECDREMELKRK